MLADLKKLWLIPAFRTLLIARIISNIGNGLGPIALAFGVLSLEGATPTSLSIVMAAQLGPMVAFMLFGGVLADRYPRALVVGTSDIFLSGFVVANGVMLINGSATVMSLAIIAFISGSLNALWWPAFAGLIPEVVPEEDLQSANSIVGLGANAANIAGTVAGGIIVAGIGAGWAMVTDGVSFFIAGILVFTLRKFGKTRDTTEHTPSVFEDLAHGWKEFSSRSWVVTVVAGYSILVMIFESVLGVVGPVHAEQELGGPKPWSYILAALSVGMMAGVLVSLKVRPKRPLLIALIAQLGVAAWIFAIGVTNWIPIIMVSAFFAGIALDFFFVLWQTAMQSNIPRESLSRVSSYDAFGSLVFAPFGLVIAGPITEKIGTEQTLIGMAIIFAVVLAAMLSVASVRNLRGQNVTADSL
ncbi:MAG: MFS transporter [Candidatus Nanopelagicales bacterium]|jgi:MFS family permease|nr:MFS transporter [Candidatus Nanopelagicales bacterium]MDP4666942.1 MFS transporter [Candidatus Nanopelagicales bacterium]MDP4895912.1 MFS transporter [Candidatus Nanopelagicales bacterium]